MVYCACILCCSMNFDHCMYVFHDFLLIMCYQSLQTSQEVWYWCGMPSRVRMGVLQLVTENNGSGIARPVEG